MQRKVELEGQWWKMTIGAKLGQDKDSNMLLFLPRKWVFGYKCIFPNGDEKIVNAELMQNVKPLALTFYHALPPRPLKGIDLMK